MLAKLQYGRADTIRIPLIKRASQDFAVGADWTPAAGDVKVTQDAGSAANIGTLPTATAVGNAAEWAFPLTAAELSGRRIRVAVADAATKTIEDDFLLITTVDHPLAQEPNGCTYYGLANGGAASSLTLTAGNGFLTNAYRGHLIRLSHGGLTVIGTVAKDATATKWKTTTTLSYKLAGAFGTKAATTAQVFTANYTVNTAQTAGNYWGAFLLQYDGTNFSTKAPANDQTYASEAAAIAACDALDPDSGKIRVGHITVQSKTNVKWTANTDDLTAASGCAAANFYDAPLLGTLEEWNEVSSYTFASLVCATSRAWSYRPQQAVDEVWLLGSPYAGTTGDFADAILARSTRGGSDPAAGNGETVGEALAIGGSGKFTDDLAGNIAFKHGDGTAIVTRTITRTGGTNAATGLA